MPEGSVRGDVTRLLTGTDKQHVLNHLQWEEIGKAARHPAPERRKGNHTTRKQENPPQQDSRFVAGYASA